MFNRKCVSCLTILFCVLIGARVRGEDQTPPTVSSMIASLDEALSVLRHSRSAFEVRAQRKFGTMPDPGTHNVYRGVTFRDGERANVEWSCRPADESWKELPIEWPDYGHSRMLFDGDKTYFYVTGAPDGGPSRVSISGSTDRANDVVISTLWNPGNGGFLDGGVYGIGNPCFSYLPEVLRRSTIKLRPAKEIIDDVSCFVLEAEVDGGMLMCWLAPERGYQCVKTSWGHGPIPNFVDEAGIPIARVQYTVDRIRFLEVGGHFIAVAGREIDTVYRRGYSFTQSVCEAKRTIAIAPVQPAITYTLYDVQDGTRASIFPDESRIRCEIRDGKVVVSFDQKTIGLSNAAFEGSPGRAFNRDLIGFGAVGVVVLVAMGAVAYLRVKRQGQ